MCAACCVSVCVCGCVPRCNIHTRTIIKFDVEKFSLGRVLATLTCLLPLDMILRLYFRLTRTYSATCSARAHDTDRNRLKILLIFRWTSLLSSVPRSSPSPPRNCNLISFIKKFPPNNLIAEVIAGRSGPPSFAPLPSLLTLPFPFTPHASNPILLIHNYLSASLSQ